MNGTEHLLSEHGASLLHVAASSIDHGLQIGKPLTVPREAYPGVLYADGASFVTLKKSGDLRGCVGSPEAYKPLVEDVADNAFAAAFRDSRFSRLSSEERSDLSISVSLLSPPEPLECMNETGLLQSLRPFEDGLIIEGKGRRALFLPQVWEMLPEPTQFLSQLKLKAGLAVDDWPVNFKAWRFASRSVSSDNLSEPNGLWC